MVSAADVPPEELIATVKVDLKKSIKMPAWAKFVKTGAGRQRPPEQEDWWWTRAASILRKVYLYGPVGVNRLRTAFGGRADRGVKPEKTVKAGGKIIREILKQLEGLGYIKKTKKGREITPKGQSYLDKRVPGFGKAKAESPKDVKPEPKPEEKTKEGKKPEPKKKAESPKEKKSPKEKEPMKETPKKEGKPEPEVKKKQEAKEKPRKEEKKPKAEKEGKPKVEKKPEEKKKEAKLKAKGKPKSKAVLVSERKKKTPVKKAKTKKVKKKVGKSK
jgi:small subunit ribosomal protein S19e